MALTQWYNTQFSEGIEWTKKAAQDAANLGMQRFGDQRYAAALFYAGVNIILEEILKSFAQTWQDFDTDASRGAGGLVSSAWGISLDDQDRIAVTVMKNVVVRDQIYIPKSSGPLSPAEVNWNKGQLLTGIYMAGRWQGAKLFYENVMWNKFGWRTRTGSSMPFWADEGVFYQ